MSAKNTVLVGGALALGVAALVGWRVARPHGPAFSPHVAIVRDRSMSTTSGCAAVGGIVERSMDAAGLTRDSTMVLLATGDSSTNDEPIELVRMKGFKARRATESKRTATEKDHALLARLVSKCEESGSTDHSPIFLALRRGVEELRALGCRAGTGCSLDAQTDGAENGESAIRRALAGAKNVVLPDPIDNTGIAVHLCGLAETAGPVDAASASPPRRQLRGAKRADITVMVMRRLFTHPELVTVEPHCPRLGENAPGNTAPETVAAR